MSKENPERFCWVGSGGASLVVLSDRRSGWDLAGFRGGLVGFVDGRGDW